MGKNGLEPAQLFIAILGIVIVAMIIVAFIKILAEYSFLQERSE